MSTTSTTPAPPAKNSESFFQHVEAFFKKAETFVSTVFVKVFGASAAQQFAQGAEALLKTSLGQIALQAVQDVASIADNKEKFNTAASQIASTAKAQGIAVSDSLINMLIELCVQRVKGSFGTATA